MSNSVSYQRFFSAIMTAKSLRDTSCDVRLRPIAENLKKDFLHASLASYVGSWDAYLNQVIKEFTARSADISNAEFTNIHQLMESFVDTKLQKFNTPNWENSRELLISCAGYDPISDWPWKKASQNRQNSQEFLNQILKVRHSFAHGFSIPAYHWTQTPTGKTQLNLASLCRVEKFLSHLVRATD
jgi:hypothetical protein